MPNVLIVDDDRFTRTLLKTIFTRDSTFTELGVEVVTAEDGEAGLEDYRRYQPDVVITDLQMPKLDGFGLCDAIRAEPNGERVHLVVMSGIYRETATVDRVKNDYGGAYFAKPYELRDMAKHAGELLRQGAGAVDAAPELPPANALHGELMDRPLPAILLDLLDDKATGRLSVKRAGITKEFELLVGHPISATSSARDETLGNFLVATGRLTSSEHDTALQRAAQKRSRIGEVLLAMNLLTPEELVEALTAQTRHKLTQTLRWPEGQWHFEPSEGVSAGARGNAIDLTSTIVHGLRESANLDALPAHITRINGLALSLLPRGQNLLATHRSIIDPEAISAQWSDGVTMRTLLEQGVEHNPLIHMLDVLLLCGGVTADQSPPAEDATSERVEAPSDLSVNALSEHAQQQQLRIESADDDPSLYAELFADTPTASGEQGHQPLVPAHQEPLTDAVRRDSGFIDVSGMNLTAGTQEDTSEDPEADSAKRLLLEEYLRVQNLDHYRVLLVEPEDDPAIISAAVVERRSKYSFDWFARFDLGRDYAKLEEIHAAYDNAFRILLDDDKRAEYDQELAGGGPAQNAPTLAAEVAYREGEKLLAAGKATQAVSQLKTAAEAAPAQADYHSTLGWAIYCAGKQSARAADQARPHLNKALSLNPDHAQTHEYKGTITANLGNDDVEATFHLERALEQDPTRPAALEMLEKLWTKRGQTRPLERQYRKLIYRTAGHEPELGLWLKLGELYRSALDEPGKARVAFESAARLAPDNPKIQAALADLESGSPNRFFERSEVLRTRWRRSPGSATPALELLRAAEQASLPDAVFMIASALVARDMADQHARKLYERYRPRFVVRAQQTLDASAWDKLRSPDDVHEVGALFEALAPAIWQAAPLTLADLEVDETMALSDADLPPAVIKVRAYIAHVLGVPVPPIYSRPDFGNQIHVGALAQPILLAGDEALASPERSELSFRLGRAMTYLWPGRAIGGSRPGTFLKEIVLTTANWMSGVADEATTNAAIRAGLEALPAQSQETIRGLITLLTRASTLNLSRWSRALGRTADRMGLLLCGDLPAAIRFAEDSGPEATDKLLWFAIGPAHLGLRNQLGLSIDV